MPGIAAVAAAALLAAATLAEPRLTAAAAQTGQPQRVEARSADLLAVGLVRGDRMVIHLSRLIDNAPVRNAAVTVRLRGIAHPAIAEADGSFMLETQDLSLPGAAAVEFQVAQDGAAQSGRSETLQGTLQGAADAPQNKNTARQLWWWVLNFAVCIGFLWLISQRRKRARGSK
jgi:hypothetical protein